MNNMLSYLVEVSICLFLFYGLYRFALVNEKRFNLNRAYLLSALVVSFIIPALSFDFAPNELLVAPTIFLGAINVGSEGTIVGNFSFNSLLVGLYAIGAGIALLRLMSELRTVWRLQKEGQLVGHEKGIKIIDTMGQGPTGSFFKTIFWTDQEKLSEDQKRSILEHEYVHAREGHSIDVMLAEVVGIILWFNPAVYLLRKSIKANHEYIADAWVAGSNLENYMHLLATQALEANNLSLKSFFSNTQIINRMRMLKSKRNNSNGTRYLLIVPLMLALFVAFSCESQLTDQPDKVANLEQAALEDVKTEVTDNAEPEGGFSSFVTYMQENIKYPKEAQEKGVEGNVMVEFIVDKKGNVTNVKVLRGIGSGCDEEAKRIVANSPKWVPAVLDGEKVNQKLVLPISFKL